MLNKGVKLLQDGPFPDEKDNSILSLLDQLRQGDLGISLDSFEDIYRLSSPGNIFPVGCVNFDDKTNVFVVSWIDDFKALGLAKVEDYRIRVRNYPVKDYPILSLLLEFTNGTIDPDTKEDLWISKEMHLDISFTLTRIKLYQLLNADEILFCLFNNSPEELDSFGFPLDKMEQDLLLHEILSCFDVLKDKEFENHFKAFSSGSKFISKVFNSRGLPKERDALDVYLKRKDLCKEPHKHNWGDFTLI